MTADLNVYIWVEGVPDLIRDCIVICVWLLPLQPLVSSLSLMKKWYFLRWPSFPAFFFGTGRQLLLVNIEEWWLFLKIHIVPNYCSFVCSDKIPILRGVIKICCNSSSSHPPLLQLSTVRQWKFPPFGNVRESTKLQSSLWRKKKTYCHFRNTTKSSIRLASRNEIKFLRSGGTKTVQQREQMLLLRERG